MYNTLFDTREAPTTTKMKYRKEIAYNIAKTKIKK
jgi:hypothetical protein